MAWAGGQWANLKMVNVSYSPSVNGPGWRESTRYHLPWVPPHLDLGITCIDSWNRYLLSAAEWQGRAGWVKTVWARLSLCDTLSKLQHTSPEDYEHTRSLTRTYPSERMNRPSDFAP